MPDGALYYHWIRFNKVVVKIEKYQASLNILCCFYITEQEKNLIIKVYIIYSNYLIWKKFENEIVNHLYLLILHCLIIIHSSNLKAYFFKRL